MKFILRVFFIFIVTVSSSFPQLKPYKNGVVSSANEVASRIGIQIMRNGGNAIDASVGVGFALAVVFPQAGNIGGGGFMVLHLANGKNTTIDFREKAPGLASRNMFLDRRGNVVNDLSLKGNLAAGVPGSVAGLLYALEKYGTKSRPEVMNYAIELAEKGFIINKELADALNNAQKDFSQFPSTMKIFGKRFNTGDVLIQKDLANTLKLIRDKGLQGFYEGVVADMIVKSMTEGNGIMTASDLLNYRALERNPVTGTYRGYEIITMGPPSSGGISLIYLLNALEMFDLRSYGFENPRNAHILADAMKRVYADRSEYMGDMDFFNVPVSTLISKLYARKVMENFNESIATKSIFIKPNNLFFFESDQTTHFSAVDKNGNMVAVTTTINSLFGNKVVVDGAGFFMNNEMDDFASKPGVPNQFGLIGNDANAIEPNKRMLSSMTPVIIFKDKYPFMALGSPGGSRIITTVLQTIVNVIDYQMRLEDAINAPRFHHQWLPDVLQYEKGRFDNNSMIMLRSMGYDMKEISDFARVDAVMFLDSFNKVGYSDRRGNGKAEGY
jgi:gamma-glutamyltranspeptidase / glutathione hydrolase